MQTSKKRIYGALGLATVAGMTIVASSIPAPEAYAEGTSSDVQLKVTVLSNNLAIDISGSIQDGSSTSKDSVTIPIIVTDVKDLQYQVVARQEGIAGSEEVAAGTIQLDAAGYSGTYNLDLALKNYHNYLVTNHGYDANKEITFTLTATGIGVGGGLVEDSITFKYGNITIDPGDNINPDAPDDQTNVPTDDKGDPEIKIETNDETEKIHVIVKDPETGEVIWEGDVTPDADGNIKLPFDENGVPSDKYEVIVQAYDRDGNLIGTSSLVFRYVRPDGAGIPNTGGVSIAGLNIARSDFLISSALAFCLVSLGGIYLLHRKSARK